MDVSGNREPFHWRTGIAYKTRDRIVIRGYDLNELTGRVSFAEMIYLIFRGELPPAAHGRMLDAVLGNFAEHAFSPSSAAARFVMAGGVPLHVAAAGGLLALGDLHATGDRPAQIFQAGVKRAGRDGVALPEMAERIVREYRERKERMAGFHHPQHIRDPRTHRLLELADQLGVTGDHVTLARSMEEATEKVVGRRLYLNAPGAIGAICSDLGFEPTLVKAIAVVSRCVGIVAHSYEEMSRERGWRASRGAEITQPLDLELQRPEFYDGPGDRALPADRV
jgi:citrate synthase